MKKVPATCRKKMFTKHISRKGMKPNKEVLHINNRAKKSHE